MSCRRYILAVVLLAVAAATGCGSPSTAGAAPVVTVTPAALSLVTRTGTYATDQNGIGDAENRLVANCMALAGLRYIVPAANKASIDEPTDYGLYKTYSGKQGNPNLDKTTNDYYVAHLPSVKRSLYMEALRGTKQSAIQLSDGRRITYPTDGCEPTARIRLYGELETQVKVFYVPQIVQNAIEKEVQKEPRHLAALADWRRCMAAGGAPYSSSADARDQIDAMYRKTGPTLGSHQREITVASLDQKCAADAQTTEVDLSLCREKLDALPEADRAELNRLAVAWRTAAAAALKY